MDENVGIPINLRLALYNLSLNELKSFRKFLEFDENVDKLIGDLTETITIKTNSWDYGKNNE